MAWYCVNASCPEQLIRNVEHFVSRATLDIVGFGIKIVEQLIEAKLLSDYADIYSLQRDDVLSLEGFAEKKVDNLLDSIELSKEKSLAQLLFALGIRGVGEVVASDLARQFGNIDQLAKASKLDLESIEGIGPNIAKAIVDWFAQSRNQDVLSKLKKFGMWPTMELVKGKDIKDLPLSGKSFVITGTLPSLSRKAAKEYIQEHGGKVLNSVSAKTDYLLAGEKAGSKLDKANALGVAILDQLDNLAGTILSQDQEIKDLKESN